MAGEPRKNRTIKMAFSFSHTKIDHQMAHVILVVYRHSGTTSKN